MSSHIDSPTPEQTIAAERIYKDYLHEARRIWNGQLVRTFGFLALLSILVAPLCLLSGQFGENRLIPVVTASGVVAAGLIWMVNRGHQFELSRVRKISASRPSFDQFYAAWSVMPNKAELNAGQAVSDVLSGIVLAVAARETTRTD